MTAPRTIVIVGAGVIGVSTAYALTRRGAKVIVLDRGEIAGAASFGNAGSIAPGHLPINRPGRLKQVIKWMFDETSPLYVPPRLDPALWRWFWEFNRHCTEEHLTRSMQALGPLGHVSQRLFDEWADGGALDCDYRRRGYYEVFRTEKALAGCRAEGDLLRRHGYAPRDVSGAELREVEPSFNAEVRGGVFHEEASTLHPQRFVVNLAKRAGEMGVTFRTGVEVAAVVVKNGAAVGVRTPGGEIIAADVVVIACGAYSRPLVEALGSRLPLQGGKGYHRDNDTRPGAAPPLKVACVLGEVFVFCTPVDDFVRFAGTLEFSGLNDLVRPARLEKLTRGAGLYFTEVGEAGIRSEWAGLRPCLPDGLPAVGFLPFVGGVFVATGHAMMGLTLGPVTGVLAAEMILDGHPSMDLAALRPDRF